MIIIRAEASVMREEMMQVNRIMMTIPFSIRSSTTGIPSAVFSFMPTITMAIAPAAWAEVSPNIMCDAARGNLKSHPDR